MTSAVLARGSEVWFVEKTQGWRPQASQPDEAVFSSSRSQRGVGHRFGLHPLRRPLHLPPSLRSLYVDGSNRCRRRRKRRLELGYLCASCGYWERNWMLVGETLAVRNGRDLLCVRSTVRSTSHSLSSVSHQLIMLLHALRASVVVPSGVRRRCTRRRSPQRCTNRPSTGEKGNTGIDFH